MVALILAGLSLSVAVAAILRAYQPSLALKRLTIAFEELEDEWENQKASFATTLGRISRLKRDIMPTPLQREEAGAADTDDPALNGSGFTPKQAKIQDEIMRRRQHGLLRR